MALNKMYQTVEKLGNGNKEFAMAHGTLHHALLYAEHHYGCTLIVNGIVMPSTEDDSFFYSSVKAAEEGNVWIEEAHCFGSKEFKSSLEGGCLSLEDLDNEFSKFGGWNEFILKNIRDDITGINPVTANDDSAIVFDEDVAKLCDAQDDLAVTKYGTGEIIDDGTEDTVFYIFKCEPLDDETDLDDYEVDDEDEEEEVFTIGDSASVIKPIAKSIFRAVKNGKLNWNGFTCPRFNKDKNYELSVIKDKDGYYNMYSTPFEKLVETMEDEISPLKEKLIEETQQLFAIDTTGGGWRYSENNGWCFEKPGDYKTGFVAIYDNNMLMMVFGSGYSETYIPKFSEAIRMVKDVYENLDAYCIDDSHNVVLRVDVDMDDNDDTHRNRRKLRAPSRKHTRDNHYKDLYKKMLRKGQVAIEP